MLPDNHHGKRAANGLPENLNDFLKSTQDVQFVMASGVNPDGSLKPQAIRALLKFMGVELRSLAASASYSDAYFHQVIDRHRKDLAVENLIAERLGLDADRIWGRESVA